MAVMGGRRRINRWVQWVLIIVVVGEITSLLILDRLDGMFSTSSLKSLASYYNPLSNSKFPGDAGTSNLGQQQGLVLSDGESNAHVSDVLKFTNTGKMSCEGWLEEVDKLPEGRNFTADPIYVAFGETQVWDSCGVGCVFRSTGGRPDGSLRRASTSPPWRSDGTSHIIRSMESASYYPENDLQVAHGTGYDVVMTTNLASDVPVGYFSWAEYDIMGPVQPKTEESLAAAFISNCAAHNFRLEALEELRKFKVSVDSYGKCHRNREGGNKLETLKRYKFSLAFENSNEDDYVTEKFWQSLVAGSVPVVVGAPNIEEFAPAPNAFLHIKSIQDVGRVASQIRYLGSNLTAYNETLRWKYEGPSDSFKALVDMAAVHSSCRLCIHLATIVRDEEEKELADAIAKRPCQCVDHSGVVTYHLYVRERGRFEPESVFLRSTDLSIAGLEAAVLAKFRSLKHVPIWWPERPEMIRGDGILSIYKIYPVGLTQRDALYSVYFHTDEDVKGFLDESPCSKLEVIFV